MNLGSLASMWAVFMLFLIPIGGGIPAGVLLARTRGIDWTVMTVLYLISDIVLALVFEPLVLLMIRAGKKYRFIARLNEAMKQSTNKTISRYGITLGPLALIMVSFGVDPMTGRTAALAAGHGFISGWTLAIMGDMLFFLILMISTLCLNNFLGDGTWTAVIIMVAMIVIPGLIRRLREWWKPRKLTS